VCICQILEKTSVTYKFWEGIWLGEERSIVLFLIQFGIPVKLVGLLKICLNETCSKVCIGKNLSNAFPMQNYLKDGDAFITIDFQLWSRICYLEDPRKWGRIGTEWNTSAPSLCWLCQYIGWRQKYCKKKNIGALLEAIREVGLEKSKCMFMPCH